MLGYLENERMRAVESRLATLEDLYNKVCQRLRAIEGTPLSRINLGEAAHEQSEQG